MCSRLAILKVWNTSDAKSSEQKWRGEQSVTLRASLSLLICLVPCNHANQSTQSKPEVLGDCAGGAGTGPVQNLTFLVCVSCRSDLLVARVSVTKISDVKPFCSEGRCPWPTTADAFPNLLVPLIQQWQLSDPSPGRSALTGITTNNRGRMEH